MALSANDIRILRCAINRVAEAAAAAGIVNQRVAESSSVVNAELVRGMRDAAAFVTTMWEVRGTAASRRYPSVALAYNSLLDFLRTPTVAGVRRYGSAALPLFIASAALRHVKTSCADLTKLRIPGLWPFDPRTLLFDAPAAPDGDGGVPATVDDLPEAPPPPPPRQAGVSRPLGYALLAVMALLATVVTGTAAFRR